MNWGFLIISSVLFLPLSSDKWAKLASALWLLLQNQGYDWVHKFSLTDTSSQVIGLSRSSYLWWRPSPDSGVNLDLGCDMSIWDFMPLACFPLFHFGSTVSHNCWFIDLFNIYDLSTLCLEIIIAAEDSRMKIPVFVLKELSPVE